MAAPKSCAILGHSPMRFAWGFDEEAVTCRDMKLELAQQIMVLLQQGVTHFSVACDYGIGLYAAEIISILCRTCIFCVCRKHCRRRAVFATPCKDRHCMPYILSGSPLLCRCSTFGGNFPSRTNRLVCILWRFGSVFLMDVHRGSLWRSFAILPIRIVGFCGFARLFHPDFFSHISPLRFLFDPTMSFDSCFPAFRRM